MTESAVPKVTIPGLDDYSKWYENFFTMRRENGILEIKMQHEGGPAQYSFATHNAWGRIWQDVGRDPDNEVIIFGGTGDTWFDIDRTAYDKPLRGWTSNELNELYADAVRVMESLVFSVEQPTIGLINGPTIAHTEFTLACDLTIASETATFIDPHFLTGVPPGDGQGLAFQELLGSKRAAYYLYTGDAIDARTALELGLVNEVVPAADLYPRAWELAEMMMRRPLMARRMTSAIVKRPWKQRLVNDFGFHVAHELYGIIADNPVGEHGGHNLESLD